MLGHELAGAREENLLAYPSEQQVSIRADVARRNRTNLQDIPSHHGRTNSLSMEEPSVASHGSDFTQASLADYTPFAFDRVFQPDTTQADVYEAVEEMILP